jgi:hypothetical protein
MSTATALVKTSRPLAGLSVGPGCHGLPCPQAGGQCRPAGNAASTHEVLRGLLHERDRCGSSKAKPSLVAGVPSGTHPMPEAAVGRPVVPAR